MAEIKQSSITLITHDGTLSLQYSTTQLNTNQLSNFIQTDKYWSAPTWILYYCAILLSQGMTVDADLISPDRGGCGFHGSISPGFHLFGGLWLLQYDPLELK